MVSCPPWRHPVGLHFPVCGGLPQHDLMIAGDGDDGAALVQVQDHVHDPAGIRATIDKITEQNDRIGRGRLHQFQEGLEGAGTPVNIAYRQFTHAAA